MKEKSINLYIAFFHPWRGLLSFCEENKKYNNLVNKTKESEKKIKEQKDEFDKK